MASSLIQIVNNTLRLADNIILPNDNTIRVISILGKARMGKSTFLNAMAKHLNPIIQPPFATQSNDDHCTRGVDYYYEQTTHTLFLDCQGLALEDSSSDPLLLLVVYLISDTIIFNERMMLQNTALKLLEPVCLFAQYVDIEEAPKPTLVFRISDADLVQDPDSNLTKVMTRYDDQYQSIRDTVVNIFQSPLRIVKTDTLDKDAKAAVECGDYNSLFANHKLGFDAAIDTIRRTLPVGKTANAWKSLLYKIVDSINNNKRIKANMLDVVSLIANNELLEWERNLAITQPQLFTDIPVDGLRTTYIETVEPRIAARRSVLTCFETTFEKLPDSIKTPYLSRLEQRLSTPIDKATKLSAQLAELAIAPLLIDAQRNRVLTFTNRESAFLTTPIVLAEFRVLRDTLSNYHEPIAKKYMDWLTSQENTLRAAVEHAKAMERQTVSYMSYLCQDAMKRYRIEALSIVNMNTAKHSIDMEAVVSTTLKDLLVNLRKTTQDKTSSAFIYSPIVMEVAFVNTILTATTITQAETFLPSSHALVKETYDGFVESMLNYESLYVDLMRAKFMKEGEDNATYVKRLEQELATLKSEIARIQNKWDCLKLANDSEDPIDDDPSEIVKVVVSEVLEFVEKKPEPTILEVPLVSVKCCGWW